MKHTLPPAGRETGFTLIELLVVMVILAVLFALSSINLGQPQSTADLTTTVSTLMADIKDQQMLAMSGDQGGLTSPQPHGLYFQSNQYTLFAQSSFNKRDTYVFVVGLPSSIQLATTEPSSQLIFSLGTGEVQGYTAGSDTITLSTVSDSRTITVNRFGAITEN